VACRRSMDPPATSCRQDQLRHYFLSKLNLILNDQSSPTNQPMTPTRTTRRPARKERKRRLLKKIDCRRGAVAATFYVADPFLGRDMSSYQLPPPSDKSKRAKKRDQQSRGGPSERDPLLEKAGSAVVAGAQNISRNISQNIRARRTSPNQHLDNNRPMIRGRPDLGQDAEHDGYESIEEATQQSRSQSNKEDDDTMSTNPYSQQSESAASSSRRRMSSAYRVPSPSDTRSMGSGSQPPLLEIPEEIYAVRRSSLQVLKPLTKTWVSGTEFIVRLLFF